MRFHFKGFNLLRCSKPVLCVFFNKRKMKKEQHKTKQTKQKQQSVRFKRILRPPFGTKSITLKVLSFSEYY